MIIPINLRHPKLQILDPLLELTEQQDMFCF